MIVSTSQAIAIYEAYPRKVKKPLALRAIMKAIEEHGFEKLIARTKEYAERSQSKDLQFIPYPATFFNQQMFDDDYEAMFPKNGGNHAPEVPLWQRIKACEKLIADITSRLQRTSLPNPLQYEIPDGERFRSDYEIARQKRDKLKAEKADLVARLAELNRQAAYAI